MSDIVKKDDFYLNTVVKYSSINDTNLFVSKYQLYLPSEEELKRKIERNVLEFWIVKIIKN